MLNLLSRVRRLTVQMHLGHANTETV